jgi:hypothetical protein
MSLRVTMFRRLPRSFYRGRLLDQLAQATADAFGTKAPDWKGSPYAERLTAYAEYTATEAARLASPGAPAGGCGAIDVVMERLYGDAADLGADLRRRLGISGMQEALMALGLLYRQIGIDIGGRTADGASGRGAADDAVDGASAGQADIQVNRCFFADHYSESTCRVMSALDAGVVDGLFGGAAFEFSQRITDGSPCCRAVIRWTEARP